MPERNPSSLPDWSDPDDAPEITTEFLEDAEVFDGDRFVRRARGRPPSPTRKEQINIRLDADVLQHLRASGPGWQTRVNDLLRAYFAAAAGPQPGPFEDRVIVVAETVVVRDEAPPVPAAVDR